MIPDSRFLIQDHIYKYYVVITRSLYVNHQSDKSQIPSKYIKVWFEYA